LENRYPKDGTFCEIQVNPAPCLEISFREKVLVLNNKKIPLKMLLRVHYEFEEDGRTFEIKLQSEHRFEISEKSNPSYPKKMFHRSKNKSL
jgi:hypothetical protein